MKVHTFSEKLKEGEAFEKMLDTFFSKWYRIEPVTDRKLQKAGIDRIFIDEETGRRLKVEYKADSMARKTGNVFIETISNSSTFEEGWVMKCQADVIIYFIPPTSEIIAIEPLAILKSLPEWIQLYKKAPAKNPTYWSYGRLVPVVEFKKRAKWTRKIS
ncbi:hypothetical protein ACFO25_09995 [Paenactinomyces guangxiensis]|uniref:Uncharacterized protein n=1 Tax=Paenactinomyces guangxiensis TaxID=1490290 RepID=A0A7W1WSN6_9BACL|nr:hypothetical protein [Paenactinomyces guangxiensis]MBA4495116.1 hypothetical protein [Paenactinomyces guangxiensis]MBH8592200.1 hypothetical protein [Paenactinomyces guangxiensis]